MRALTLARGPGERSRAGGGLGLSTQTCFPDGADLKTLGTGVAFLEARPKKYLGQILQEGTPAQCSRAAV